MEKSRTCWTLCWPRTPAGIPMQVEELVHGRHGSDHPANDGPLLLLSDAVLSVTHCSQQDDLSKDTS